MKIHTVQLYQAVPFKTSTQKFFNIDGIDKSRDEAMNIELLAGDNIVQIKQGNSLVLVPLNNIAFMIPLVVTSEKTSKKFFNG